MIGGALLLVCCFVVPAATAKLACWLFAYSQLLESHKYLVSQLLLFEVLF